MAFEDLFKFVSSESRKKTELEFQRKVFPLGIEQRSAALDALRPLVNPKVPDTDLLYSFISAKVLYIDNPENPVEYSQRYVNGLKLFSDVEKKYIMALVLLDTAVKTLEEYPSSDNVKFKADELS